MFGLHMIMSGIRQAYWVYENQIKLKRFIQQIDEPCTLNVFIKYHSLDKIASRALDFNNYIFVSQIKNV